MKTISEGAHGPRRRGDAAQYYSPPRVTRPGQMAHTGSAAGDQAATGPWEARVPRVHKGPGLARPERVSVVTRPRAGPRGARNVLRERLSALPSAQTRAQKRAQTQGLCAAWSGGASAAHEGAPSWDDAPAPWPAARLQPGARRCCMQGARAGGAA